MFLTNGPYMFSFSETLLTMLISATKFDYSIISLLYPKQSYRVGYCWQVHIFDVTALHQVVKVFSFSSILLWFINSSFLHFQWLNLSTYFFSYSRSNVVLQKLFYIHMLSLFLQYLFRRVFLANKTYQYHYLYKNYLS